MKDDVWIARAIKGGQPARKVKTFIALVSLTALCTCALAQGNSSDYSYKKADYWYKRGLDLAGSGAYEDALDAYDKAIRIYPDNAGVWDSKAVVLGSLFISENNTTKYQESLQAYDKAIELYDKSLKSDPEDVNVWYFRGLALSNKAATMQASSTFNRNYDKQSVTVSLKEAVKSYESAIEINPKYLTAWKNKGIVLCSLGEYNDSLEDFDQAIKIDSKYALAWYNKGLALRQLGKYDESVQAYDKAIEISPKNADFWYDKGKSLSCQGNYEAAIKCYEEAIRLNPSFVDAWYQKGTAFKKLGSDIIADAAFARGNYLRRMV
jgi:tetratricopeptide (TPR) repeat protein